MTKKWTWTSHPFLLLFWSTVTNPENLNLTLDDSKLVSGWIKSVLEKEDSKATLKIMHNSCTLSLTLLTPSQQQSVCMHGCYWHDTEQKSESKEMTEQIDWRAKQPSHAGCASEHLKCWGAWDTICGYKAKDITPLIVWRRRALRIERGSAQRSSLRGWEKRTSIRPTLELFQGQHFSDHFYINIYFSLISFPFSFCRTESWAVFDYWKAL